MLGADPLSSAPLSALRRRRPAGPAAELVADNIVDVLAKTRLVAVEAAERTVAVLAPHRTVVVGAVARVVDVIAKTRSITVERT